ncbi:DUF6896 domain-containing protein [Streptomyces globisporus]|uniref:DUF6896 domain-containing protein n=1 Tax=Streptomyces globisporus TaxID=1908 RepID=UPI00379C6631
MFDQVMARIGLNPGPRPVPTCSGYWRASSGRTVGSWPNRPAMPGPGRCSAYCATLADTLAGHLPGTYSYTVHGAGCRFVSDNGTEADLDVATDGSEIFDLWRLRLVRAQPARAS